MHILLSLLHTTYLMLVYKKYLQHTRLEVWLNNNKRLEVDGKYCIQTTEIFKHYQLCYYVFYTIV